MKRYLILIALTFFMCNLDFSQTASTYFPSDTGYKWFFKNTPLDSLNHPIDSAATVEIDSFATIVNYHGKSADLILSKTGLQNTILFQNYTDSSFVSFDGSNGYSYLNGLNVSIPGLNSSEMGKKLSNNSITSIKGWQLFYQFGATVNSSYSIFTADTNVNYDSSPLSLHVVTSATLLNDENIMTQIGNFNSKKFLIQTNITVKYEGFFTVTQFTVNDTEWIAEGNWILKSFEPSTFVDMSKAGLSSFYILGHEQEPTNAITGIKQESNLISDFHLYQNYPNPFNPSTKIIYSIPSASRVKIAVYNVLGKEVVSLLDKYQNAGTYQVDFNPSQINGGLPSGIYFYRLESQNKFAVKKLVYLK
jgi:Secretion system C-terminal sorting domain